MALENLAETALITPFPTTNGTNGSHPNRTIYELIPIIAAEVGPVGKDSRNLEQGYNFRGIDAVVNAIHGAMSRHGVFPVPRAKKVRYRDVLTVRDKKSREVTVMVHVRLYGPRGDYVTAIVPGESMDTGDKGSAKAMSVALRIALLQTFTLPTSEPDPDSFSPERAADRDEWENAAPAVERVSSNAPTRNKIADAMHAAIKTARTPESLALLRARIDGYIAGMKLNAQEGDEAYAAVTARETEMSGQTDPVTSTVEPGAGGLDPGVYAQAEAEVSERTY